MSVESESLNRLVDLTETLVKIQMSETIENELSDPNKRKLYDLTGKASIREIEKRLSLSKSTISTIWQKWATKGLIKKEGQNYRKIF